MVKFTILLRRNPAMSPADFAEHHRTVHAPLFMSIPAVKAHVRRYVQQHALPVELPGLPPAKYDGITELWFDEAADIAAVFGDAEYMERIRPDEERFLDLHGCDFIVSEETTITG
ncbi:EthD domain-containing protein [Caulobacter sp. S45]|uniref:EthD domain-containing protein n=1 Tax=Caulobacter sp. S45 TaxID=1641861 RepID=UPI0015766D79|nr:EthD domain-containing protein [Caulobacter sp. S45]